MYFGNFPRQAQLIPGSVLRAKSSGLWPDHFGIFAGTLPDGTPMVLHSIEGGVALTPFEEFALGRLVEVMDTPCTLEHQRAILGRAYSQIGHPYHVLFANCEHFANWAFFGVPDSPQLRTYAVGTGLAGVALYALIRLGEDRGPRPARRRKARG